MQWYFFLANHNENKNLASDWKAFPIGKPKNETRFSAWTLLADRIEKRCGAARSLTNGVEEVAVQIRKTRKRTRL